MPSYGVRKKMGEAVERSNKPTKDDLVGGRHEEGGAYGKTVMGAEVAMSAEPGAIPAPGEKKVGIDPMKIDFNQDGRSPLTNISIFGQLQLSGTYHLHPEGVWDYQTNSTFVQPPSQEDLFATQNDKTKHGMTGISYVLAPGIFLHFGDD
jgi:hypothetical protein